MQYLDFTLVVDKNNKPCVPILNGRAGYLLRNNKAKIINHDPLVIKRIDDYKSDFENRDIFELKIDSGYLNIGFSVSDNYHEYLAGQVELLKGMSDRLTNRNGYRRTRRSRIRYRKNKNVDYKTVHNPTYKNGNEEGWFAPSIQHKIDSHIRLIDKIASWVPVDKVIVEVAKFDIQMIKALADGKEISGKDYQNGEMKGYENAAAYVRDRDKHTCRLCGANKNVVIEVHHIQPRSKGGTDKPSNLISLCHSCHRKVHSNNNDNKYFEKVKSMKLSDTYKDSTYMNMVRWELFERLSGKYDVKVGYGYQTKINRRNAGLRKFHYTDAVCINDYKDVTLTENIYIVDQKRCNDRSMETFSDAKYIDVRDGKEKSGNTLYKERLPNAPSKRVTQKEYINNMRQFRGKKIKPGKRTFVCNSYCLKCGDLIYINSGKHKGNIAEVESMQKLPNGNFKIRFTYKAQTVKYPSINIKPEEYELLKSNLLDKVKIVRTRRGMIWRKYNRLEYEATHADQEGMAV